MKNIQKNIKKLKQKITNISKKFKINTQKIKLLAVSKNRSVNDIKKAILCGQNSFGENYVQESQPKIKLFNNIEWHYIGQIQSNKAHIIAKNFSWCHTITNKKTAVLLNKYRPYSLPKLNTLIQINIRDNTINIDDDIETIKQLAKTINSLDNLNLRGIMAMPYFKNTYLEQIQSYKYIHLYFDILKKKYTYIDTVSLGTSHDIQAALYSGSTLLRIGSSIFDV
ncbi:hypothetical protein bbp_497 [Buchnera aphidicola str. Bp (Baizongia pistaciae)]|uniref:Pyridoxal phosphate homeostasis protein n=1 Tax=Buchnera aphidicola subsp. Baizongia pistaciae (strain Bp) TaxID=224915 RepID=PLPHP_BUCBP|nr:YggS family pyridoxal phosphate-dependent enzyme [Buchnera aphidicola]Q89A48.1 RecName: Full=Pyridoxal phosphate homeostasis protein; Short=PLP homeostasis protein [Buchnera aphidicola str. Bp (Baizongia pistaciae)]AAO27202.1 hypothetical protein bbp_497 [Buchnera aphidicola str. Bp (Baizongia pistaciae)]